MEISFRKKAYGSTYPELFWWAVTHEQDLDTNTNVEHSVHDSRRVDDFW